MTSMDSGLMIAALEHQRGALGPISRALAAVAGFPPRLSPDGWRGESADACERLEERLRDRLLAADEAVQSAQRQTRIALAELEGVG